MPYEFRLPDIGEGVAEGEILKWMVKEGDKIAEDQPLVEVMTDKVNIQIPSPRAGTVSKVLVSEGEVVKVGQAIVVIMEEGGAGAETRVAPQEPASASDSSTTVASATMPSTSDNVLATPATRKIARELGIELSSIRGTGQGGRITEQDVRNSQRTTQSAAGQRQPRGVEEVVPLRGVRKIIAERLTKAMAMTAHVTHFDEVDVTGLISLRESLRAGAEKKGIKLTFLPFFVKGAVAALKEFPALNATLDEKSNSIVIKKYYNIGIASDTEQGLIVPVIKGADGKSVFELAVEIEDHAQKARMGHLNLEEVQGSTFTITNLGGIGGLFATPIINYPEVAILGTHKIMKRPVVQDGKVKVSDMMYISLTFDHRVVDGAYAARFTNRLVEILQKPGTMMQ